MAILQDMGIDPRSINLDASDVVIAAVHQLLAKNPNMKASFKSIVQDVQQNPPSPPVGQSD